MHKQTRFPFRSRRVEAYDLYRVISLISTLFAEMRTENFEATISESLVLVGDLARADRIYVFRYDFDLNTCSNIFERCAEGINPEIANLQDVSLDGIEDWVNTHKKGEYLYIPDVSKLLRNNRVRMILEPQGVKSLLTLPLIKDGELYGFIGFDSVKEKHTYSPFERDVLSSFANVLMSAIRRNDLERSLEEQKAHTQFILEAADIGAWEWNLETDVIRINNVWAHYLGYTIDELKPLTIETWKRLTNKDDLAAASIILKETIDGKLDLYRANFRMKHKDGREVWIRDTGKVIEKKNGRATKMIGSHIDITEIKLAETKNQVIKIAIENSPIAVVITDALGNIEYVNPKFVALTGYALADVIGQNPRILKSGHHDADFYKKMWNALSHGNHFATEFCNRRKNGDLYWESASISPVFNERKEISHYVAIKIDITEKKASDDYLKHKRTQLEKEIEDKILEIEDSQKAAIIALAKITEARDADTGKHVERVQYLCKTLTGSMKNDAEFASQIDTEFVNDMFHASALHDIGKVRIADSILSKPGKLSAEEFEEIKKHVTHGADILSEMVRYYPRSKLIILGKDIAKYHHERYDGSGYIEGLIGNEIPLAARIMAVVDVYDALRSKRPYKEPYSHKEALRIIAEEAGRHFDPAIIRVLLSIGNQFETIFDSLKE